MVKVSFLGDIGLNNIYNQFFKDSVNPFEEIEDTLSNSDFAIGNLECMSAGNDGENLLKSPRLKTERDTLLLLKHLNLKAVSLAHNHIYDNLKDGFHKTIEILDKCKIDYLGAGDSNLEAESPLIFDYNGITFGFLNYVNKNTNPKMPDDADVFVSYQSQDKIKRQIEEIREKVDHVIVLLHWGGRVEEGFYPDWHQPTIAKEIIDFGADLIVGGHSHTVQPYDVYKGKYIFYSLGNFCFDDIVEGNEVYEIGRYRKRRTIVPIVHFEKNMYSVKVIHAKNRKGIILLNNSVLRKIVWRWRNTLFFFVKRSKFLWKLYFWHLKKVVPVKMYFIEANEGFFKRLIGLDYRRVLRYLKK